MSLSDRDTLGREPLTIVEIDQDSCALRYGTTNAAGTCPAVLGTDSVQKCYNTIATCPVEDSFSLTTLTLRFCTPMENTGLPKDTIVIPSLVSVDTVPTQINIAGSEEDSGPLGKRAKITATFRDHPYHDRLVDPYWDERSFDPDARGTFWSKWLARNPYHQGRALRVREGYVGQTLAEMRVRHYIIERIDGPSQGEVKIIAQDPLKLLDAARAKAPMPSEGVLDADIDEVAGSLLLAPSGSPGGVGDTYPASGIARIGSELVSYTRSNDTVTLTARGLRGTAASDHDAGDLFQDVLVIASEPVHELLRDLLVDYAGLDESTIPIADWEAESTLWLAGFNLSAWITEPTGVAEFVAEILQQASCFIWWEEEDQEVKFRAVRPFYPLVDAIPVQVSDDANIVSDSVSIEPKPDERISQIWIYYDQINPTGSVSDSANFARRRVLVDEDAESALQYNESRVKEIFARFMDAANDASTLVVATRILERYRDTPRVIRFSTDAKDSTIRTGGVIEFSHHGLVDEFGEALPTLLQITSGEEIEPGHRMEYEARPYLSSRPPSAMAPPSTKGPPSPFRQKPRSSIWQRTLKVKQS